MNLRQVDISIVGTFTPIQNLPYFRHKLIVPKYEKLTTFYITSTFASAFFFRRCRKRKFYWIDLQRGVIRDGDYNYHVITKIRQPDINGNKQLLLWGDDWDLYNNIN